MNKTILAGRIGKEIDLRFATSGTAVAKFTLAVKRDVKGKDGKYETDWLNIVCFGKTAEYVANNSDKGKRVIVMGRIQTGSYEGKDGKKVYTTDIIADQVELIDYMDSDKPQEVKAEDFKEVDDSSDILF